MSYGQSRTKNRKAKRGRAQNQIPKPRPKKDRGQQSPLYLTEADVQRLVTVKDAIATLEALFATWRDPATINLPRQRARIGKGSFNLMGAAVGRERKCSG